MGSHRGFCGEVKAPELAGRGLSPSPEQDVAHRIRGLDHLG